MENQGMKQAVQIAMEYTIECFDKFGKLKWAETFKNLVVTTGRNELLGNTFDVVAANVNWFVGLKGAGSVVAGDTMASHAGWTESTAYDEASRPAWTKDGAPSGGAMSNAASKAVFTMNATATIAGAFLTDNSTKGGSTGVLFGAGDFPASRNVEDNDVLNVTINPSVTAS